MYVIPYIQYSSTQLYYSFIKKSKLLATDACALSHQPDAELATDQNRQPSNQCRLPGKHTHTHLHIHTPLAANLLSRAGDHECDVLLPMIADVVLAITRHLPPENQFELSWTKDTATVGVILDFYYRPLLRHNFDSKKAGDPLGRMAPTRSTRNSATAQRRRRKAGKKIKRLCLATTAIGYFITPHLLPTVGRLIRDRR